MKDRYYFAYGSNMNLEQMKYRCPAAEGVFSSSTTGRAEEQ